MPQPRKTEEIPPASMKMTLAVHQTLNGIDAGPSWISHRNLVVRTHMGSPSLRTSQAFFRGHEAGFSVGLV